MGVRFPSVGSTSFVGPLPASAVETVVLVSPPLNVSLDFAQIFLLWMCNILPGTATTSFLYRLRRGTTTAGVQIGAAVWGQGVTAGVTQHSSGVYLDNPGAAAGQQYALTVVQSAATGAGTFNDGALLAFAL